MSSQDDRDESQSSRLGYAAAIVVSALGHAGLFALVFFVAPRYLSTPEAPPPSYTVKIVDNIPAGDLGTHLPRLAPPKHQEAKAKPVQEAKVEPPKPPPTAPANDKEAIALNTTSKLESPTPTPTPEPTAEPTPQPTAAPATHTPKPHATPRPTPVVKKPKPAPSIVLAKASSTPSVEQRMAKLREQLLAEHLKAEKSRAADKEDEGDDEEEAPAASSHGSKGGGPVVANVATEGHGYGVGAGTGSAGIQQDLDFLLYYQTVQKKIKEAWNFPGGSSDLTTTVDFAINPDGTLAGVRIAHSSNDSAFDDSVIRAIRRAAPFPAPPDKFRDQFAAGIQALFKLGELKS